MRGSANPRAHSTAATPEPQCGFSAGCWPDSTSRSRWRETHPCPLGRWSESQTQFDFPLDPRSLKDRLAKTVGDNIIKFKEPAKGAAPPPASVPAPPRPAPPPPPAEDILIIDDSTPTPPTPPRTRPVPAARPQPQPQGDDDILIID